MKTVFLEFDLILESIFKIILNTFLFNSSYFPLLSYFLCEFFLHHRIYKLLNYLSSTSLYNPQNFPTGHMHIFIYSICQSDFAAV